jgi:hypothetical protein
VRRTSYACLAVDLAPPAHFLRTFIEHWSRQCSPLRRLCILAMDVLENAGQSSDLSEPARNRVFDAHRLMIELRAAQKLNARLLETDGSVLLGADDM